MQRLWRHGYRERTVLSLMVRLRRSYLGSEPGLHLRRGLAEERQLCVCIRKTTRKRIKSGGIHHALQHHCPSCKTGHGRASVPERTDRCACSGPDISECRLEGLHPTARSFSAAQQRESRANDSSDSRRRRGTLVSSKASENWNRTQLLTRFSSARGTLHRRIHQEAPE
jgi:hypothetical protein